jgi:UDP-N-acetylmuramate dehydrogenase
MQPTVDSPLADFTSLAVGGPAEQLFMCSTTDELLKVLDDTRDQQLWILGYGANVLVSDKGLKGTTIIVRTSQIAREDDTVVADAGVWWDNLVQYAISERLWGLELMSAIPGGVGAAVVGNIAAYGQAVADTLQWVEVYDRSNGEVRKLSADELGLTYRYSLFQTDTLSGLVILRAAFALSQQPVTELTYQSALDVAYANDFDLSTLEGRRETILKTREAAGSLWDYRNPEAQMHTAGSFFRNPMVDADTAEKLMAHDETGKSAELLKQMNKVHGGDQKRVSASHVLLAAGFHRGQAWGPVRLHPDHILKVENTGGATAQQIYDVAQEIIGTVKEKLDIELNPEVRFLGDFDS